MAQWQRRIDLRDVWPTNDINVIADSIHKQLSKMKPLGEPDVDGEREDLAFEFEALANDKNVTTEDFDLMMEDLYDWADTKLDDQWNGKKVCWIHTQL